MQIFLLRDPLRSLQGFLQGIFQNFSKISIRISTEIPLGITSEISWRNFRGISPFFSGILQAFIPGFATAFLQELFKSIFQEGYPNPDFFIEFFYDFSWKSIRLFREVYIFSWKIPPIISPGVRWMNSFRSSRKGISRDGVFPWDSIRSSSRFFSGNFTKTIPKIAFSISSEIFFLNFSVNFSRFFSGIYKKVLSKLPPGFVQMFFQGFLQGYFLGVTLRIPFGTYPEIFQKLLLIFIQGSLQRYFENFFLRSRSKCLRGFFRLCPGIFSWVYFKDSIRFFSRYSIWFFFLKIHPKLLRDSFSDSIRNFPRNSTVTSFKILPWNLPEILQEFLLKSLHRFSQWFLSSSLPRFLQIIFLSAFQGFLLGFFSGTHFGFSLKLASSRSYSRDPKISSGISRRVLAGIPTRITLGIPPKIFPSIPSRVAPENFQEFLLKLFQRLPKFFQVFVWVL